MIYYCGCIFVLRRHRSLQRLSLLAIMSISLAQIRAQSTCAFFRLDFPQFVVPDMPDEPQLVSSLSLCHDHGQLVTCCTSSMEAKFEQFAAAHLDQLVRSKFDILRTFFANWTNEFRNQFRCALDRTERNLCRMFSQTYGHFFTSNKEIFDHFFAELRSLLDFSLTNESGTTFSTVFEKFLQRLFLAEFSLLNPMRSVDTPNATNCLLNIFSELLPFGTIPDTVRALVGRTFDQWIRLIHMLEGARSVIAPLERNFITPNSDCTKSVAQMGHCQMCMGAEYLRLDPCPSFCRHVLGRCLTDLAQLDSAWDQMIASLVGLCALLGTVHNPDSALVPLPVQLSEMIMHLQERTERFSAQAVFRCFAEEFQRLVISSRLRRRRSTPNLSAEIAENCRYSTFHQHHHFASSIPHAFRVSVDNFLDRLLQLKGFWRNLPWILCEEYGVKRYTVDEGRCWNGTFDWAERSTDERHRMDDIRKRTSNLKEEQRALLEFVKNGNPDYNERFPIDDEDEMDEGSAFGPDLSSESDYFIEPVGKFVRTGWAWPNHYRDKATNSEIGSNGFLLRFCYILLFSIFTEIYYLF